MQQSRDTGIDRTVDEPKKLDRMMLWIQQMELVSMGAFLDSTLKTRGSTSSAATLSRWQWALFWTFPFQRVHFWPRNERMHNANIPRLIKHQHRPGGDGKCEFGGTFDPATIYAPAHRYRIIKYLRNVYATNGNHFEIVNTFIMALQGV